MSEVLGPGRYFGRLLRSSDDGAFSLTLTRYRAGEHLPTHVHERPYVCLVLEGDYRERRGDGESVCGAGTVVAHCGGAPHSDRFGARGGVCLNVAWNAEGGAELLRRCGRLLPEGSWRTPRLEALGADIALAASGRSLPSEDRIRRRMFALAEEILEVGATPPRARSEPPWLAELEREIDARLERGLDLGGLARRAGVHRTTLLRAFRRHRGSSVRSAIRRRRLDRAIGEILGSRRPLAELAVDLGFADQAHLCRTLKAAAGTSPARLRASCVQERGSAGG
jgi:AraC family transcriptional regulator